MALAWQRVMSLAGKAKVAVPCPSGRNTRHVSDLRIDRRGVVWATAAGNPGNEGPFESALYALGTLQVYGGEVAFVAGDALSPLWNTKRKVEALELLPGDEGLVYFGADDEDAGSWMYIGRRRG